MGRKWAERDSKDVVRYDSRNAKVGPAYGAPYESSFTYDEELLRA